MNKELVVTDVTDGITQAFESQIEQKMLSSVQRLFLRGLKIRFQLQTHAIDI